MIDFPANPTVGQQFTAAGVTWTWDGTKWTASGLGVAYLPLAGGTMLGPIVLAADPAAALQPATKQYVDANYSGFVNKFRNAGMDVWQRGNVGVAAGTSVYTADGWLVGAVGATCQVTGSAGINKIGKSSRALFLTAASGLTTAQIGQRIESYVVAPLAGQVCTFQMCIQNNMSVPITPQLSTFYAGTVDVFPAGQIQDLAPVNLQTIPVGATAIVAYTFRSNVNAVNGYYVLVTFGSALNATVGTVGLTDVDFRVTPGWPVGLCANPPPPELRHVQAERAFCQRYYQNFANYGLAGQAAAAAGALGFSSMTLPVQMRTAPTAVFNNITYANASALAANVTDIASIRLQCALSAAGAFVAQANPLTLSAEL